MAGRFRRLGSLLGLWGGLGLLAGGGVSGKPSAPRIGDRSEYTGSADASGAVALGAQFFVVADDEDDTLRVYRRHGGGASVASVCVADWPALQLPGGKRKELDLEAAAQLGDKVFWMGSHGNSREGKIEPSRQQIFATVITEAGGRFQIELAGRPYRQLLEDFAEAPQLREFQLAASAARGRAPKDDGGLNLEGLCATPEGHLLIGFRNPIPQGHALLVPLLNPEGIIHGERARLGQPLQLDLHGRGIRDLLLVGNEYFLLAGDSRAKGLTSQLYRWAGGAAPVQWLLDLPRLNPEALIAYPDTGQAELQVLSDDGQKPSLAPERRKFRSVRVVF